MPSASLPQLPPRLHAATVASAENLTAIAHSEGIELGDKDGVSTPHLHTILYLLRSRCIEAELEPQPWLGDEWINMSEIAMVLETLGHLIVSEGLDDRLKWLVFVVALQPYKVLSAFPDYPLLICGV